ncbi:MAG: hypothetical protein ACREDX_06975 [Aestuariivirga sp.]
MQPTPALADEQAFAKPKIGGYRLDLCKYWGDKCGKPAAVAWCQSKGFDTATDFEAAPDIGGVTPTKVIGTGQVCANDGCDGFKYVTCVTDDEPPEPDEVSFSKPMIGGYRVHYCWAKGLGCGRRAARAFCQSRGFADASDYLQSKPLTQLKPTRHIGSGKRCKDPLCVAFAGITCVE